MHRDHDLYIQRLDNLGRLFGVYALCLQGAQDVFLEVRAQNSAAQALYRSLGFVQTGLRRNFYATPADDAVLMQKTL